ncbi:MAG: RNA methyltransferase [Anaerolineae bacterium]
MITSSSNDKVKYVRRLQNQKTFRDQERRLVMEGVRLVEEVVRASMIPTLVLYTEALAREPRGKALMATLRALDAPCYKVSESVMEDCSDTVTPQGILVLLPFPELAPPEPLTFGLVVDRLRDPGNLGTLLRTALAAGVEEVLLAPGSVDFSNPKVIRSAMGAHLHLPMVDTEWDTIAEKVRGCDVWLAAAGGRRLYTEVNWTRPTVLIIGGEAHGAGERARALADDRISIPMSPAVESLNAAVAAAVILFEAVRQRGLQEPPPNSA